MMIWWWYDDDDDGENTKKGESKGEDKARHVTKDEKRRNASRALEEERREQQEKKAEKQEGDWGKLRVNSYLLTPFTKRRRKTDWVRGAKFGDWGIHIASWELIRIVLRWQNLFSLEITPSFLHPFIQSSIPPSPDPYVIINQLVEISNCSAATPSRFSPFFLPVLLASFLPWVIDSRRSARSYNHLSPFLFFNLFLFLLTSLSINSSRFIGRNASVTNWGAVITPWIFFCSSSRTVPNRGIERNDRQREEEERRKRQRGQNKKSKKKWGAVITVPERGKKARCNVIIRRRSCKHPRNFFCSYSRAVPKRRESGKGEIREERETTEVLP